MSKWRRRLLRTAVVVLAIGAPGYYAVVLHSPAAGTDFPLDIAKVRKLATSTQGEKPTEVRFENVMALQFLEAMVMAGEPWRKSLMPGYSYQLVYPDKTLIIDTALERSIAQPAAILAMFDDASYQRMSEAMEKASQIVITHEHVDHIGGIASHPRLSALLPALRLTQEQMANPKGMGPAVLPADVMKGYQPLVYDTMLAIAPGVVLIKSPGHSPGSQMVYVQRADGCEMLFLGDVSWRTRNVEQERERPLFMTLLFGEDRPAVMGQLKALHQLLQAEPGIRLVPGHDGPAVTALVEQGLLVQGFRL